MRIKVGLAVALALAAAGLAAGLATGNDASGGFGTIRPPAATASNNGVAPEALSDRLAEIRRSLAIRPDQEAAWQDYVDAMRYLDQATHDFEQRQAEGGAQQDDQMERSRHALLLGAAIGDLQKNLSPDQFARARRLTEDLASSVTCVGLRGS